MKFFRTIFILSVFAIGIIVGATLSGVQALPDSFYRSLDLFSKILFIVEKEYVEAPKSDELIEGAINGMLSKLDPYSTYLTPEIYRELKVDTSGRFGGYGFELTVKDDVLTVVSPIEDTPAERAGIRPGDKIIKINGKSTEGLNLEQAVQILRESKNDQAHLTIAREGVKNHLEFTLKRESIQLKSVKFEVLPSGILFLRLTSFQKNSIEEFRAALQSAGPNIKGLIIDLRNNPGGLLTEAIAISDLFLKSGTIVSTRDRQGLKEVQKATDQGDEFAMPVAILINHGSASASEILAAALQDHGKAKLFGTTTFGKGSVQTVIDLGDDRGLKLTVAKYYTPSGKSITGKGIEPNVVIENGNQDQYFIPPPDQDKVREAAESYLLNGKIPPQKKQKKSKSPAQEK